MQLVNVKYVSYLQLIPITQVITHYHLDWGSHTDDNKQPHHDLELWQVASGNVVT